MEMGGNFGNVMEMGGNLCKFLDIVNAWKCFGNGSELDIIFSYIYKTKTKNCLPALSLVAPFLGLRHKPGTFFDCQLTNSTDKNAFSLSKY